MHYITKLKNGETVSFRPRGHSMSGKIESGQLCTVEPIKDFESLQRGDIVLCKVNSNEYLHLDKSDSKVCAFKSEIIAEISTVGSARTRFSENALE